MSVTRHKTIPKHNIFAYTTLLSTTIAAIQITGTLKIFV
jgi:hypothetical protein